MRRIGWVSWRISSLSSRELGARGGGERQRRQSGPIFGSLFGSQVSEGWRRRAGGLGKVCSKGGGGINVDSLIDEVAKCLQDSGKEVRHSTTMAGCL